MCSLQSQTSSLPSEHASLRSVVRERLRTDHDHFPSSKQTVTAICTYGCLILHSLPEEPLRHFFLIGWAMGLRQSHSYTCFQTLDCGSAGRLGGRSVGRSEKRTVGRSFSRSFGRSVGRSATAASCQNPFATGSMLPCRCIYTYT